MSKLQVSGSSRVTSGRFHRSYEHIWHIADGDLETAKKDGILTRCGRYYNGYRVSEWSNPGSVCASCESKKPRGNKQTKVSVFKAVDKYFRQLANDVKTHCESRFGIKLDGVSTSVKIENMTPFKCVVNLSKYQSVTCYNFSDDNKRMLYKVLDQATGLLFSSLEKGMEKAQLTADLKKKTGRYAYTSLCKEFLVRIPRFGDPNQLVENSFLPIKKDIMKFMFFGCLMNLKGLALQEALEASLNIVPCPKEAEETVSVWKVFIKMGQVGFLLPVLDNLIFPLRPGFNPLPKEEPNVSD